MNELSIAVRAKDMGGEAGLKALEKNAKGAEGALDNLSSTADKASRKVSSSGKQTEDSFNKVGDAADNLDTRAMGFRDTMTGVEDTSKGVSEIMKGNVFDGVLLLGMGFGDLASGVANFGVQFAKQAGQFIANSGRMVAAAASSAASHAAAAATTVAGWVAAGAAAVVNAAIVVASWIAMAIQAAISAAAMAIAWVIAMGPIILAIAAVIAIIYLLIRNWDTVKEVAVAALNVIWQAIQGVFHWIQSNWPLILAILTGPIGIAVLLIIKHWDTIRNAFETVVGAISGAISRVRDWLVSRVQDGVNLVIAAFNMWRDTASNILNGIVNIVTGLPGRISSAARGMFNGITDAMRNAINGVISIWNNLSFTLPKINIPSVDVPGLGKIGGGSFGGQTFRTPRIPYAAAGGIRSGRFIAGERGAELIDGAAGVRVRPAGETRAMLGRAGGSTVNVHLHVQGSIRSDTDLVKMLRREIERGAIPGLGASA